MILDLETAMFSRPDSVNNQYIRCCLGKADNVSGHDAEITIALLLLCSQLHARSCRQTAAPVPLCAPSSVGKASSKVQGAIRSWLVYLMYLICTYRGIHSLVPITYYFAHTSSPTQLTRSSSFFLPQHNKRLLRPFSAHQTLRFRRKIK